MGVVCCITGLTPSRGRRCLHVAWLFRGLTRLPLPSPTRRRSNNSGRAMLDMSLPRPSAGIIIVSLLGQDSVCMLHVARLPSGLKKKLPPRPSDDVFFACFLHGLIKAPPRNPRLQRLGRPLLPPLAWAFSGRFDAIRVLHITRFPRGMLKTTTPRSMT